jgi:hypothetical protein
VKSLPLNQNPLPLNQNPFPSNEKYLNDVQAGWVEHPNRHRKMQLPDAPFASVDAAGASSSPAANVPSPAATCTDALPPFIDFVWSGQLPPLTFGNQPRDAM